jgi:hypothetical protein
MVRRTTRTNAGKRKPQAWDLPPSNPRVAVTARRPHRSSIFEGRFLLQFVIANENPPLGYDPNILRYYKISQDPSGTYSVHIDGERFKGDTKKGSSYLFPGRALDARRLAESITGEEGSRTRQAGIQRQKDWRAKGWYTTSREAAWAAIKGGETTKKDRVDEVKVYKEMMSRYTEATKPEPSWATENPLYGTKYTDIRDELVQSIIRPMKILTRKTASSVKKFRPVNPGAILTGPPGNGKSTIVKHVAIEVNQKLAEMKREEALVLEVSTSSLTSMWQAQPAIKIKLLFDIGRILAPVILLVDEIDAFMTPMNPASTNYSESLTVRKEWLTGLQYYNPECPVYVFGTTNMERTELDQASTRSGRLGKFIRVGKPDWETIISILRGELRSYFPGEVYRENVADIFRTLRYYSYTPGDDEGNPSISDLMSPGDIDRPGLSKYLTDFFYVRPPCGEGGNTFAAFVELIESCEASAEERTEMWTADLNDCESGDDEASAKDHRRVEVSNRTRRR